MKQRFLFSYLILALSFAMLLSACSGDSTNGEQLRNMKPYFDLKAFFQSEFEKLASIGSVTKITSVNGHTEEHRLDSLDFKSELEIFLDADLNRSAWVGKYSVDSLFNIQNQLEQLQYSSKDKDLKTHSITVDFKENLVSKITIQNSTYTAIAQTNQLLTYIPQSGYTIESIQNIPFSSDNSYKVEVRFERN